MFKSPVLAVMSALAAASALASELPSDAPSWTGPYVGANAGYARSGSDSVRLESTPTFLVGPPLLGDQGRVTSNVFWNAANGVLDAPTNGFIGGGQVGYNHRLTDSLVAGFEADIQGMAGASGSETKATVIPLPVPLFDPGNEVRTTLSASRSIDYLGTVRGRLGMLVTPSLLAYGTGGLAYGGVNSSASTYQSRNGPVAPFGAANSFSGTRPGWTIGGGGEWRFLPNWSFKGEYLYYDLGSVTYDVGALNAVLLPPLPVPPGGTLGSASFSRATTRFDGHIFRIGLNYSF